MMYEMKRRWMGIVTVMLVVATAHASEMLTPVNQSFHPIANAKKMERQKVSKPLPTQSIDLNNASRAQLETLPGIGPAESARIVAARPFGSKTWLVANGIVPEATYQRFRKVVFVGNPSPEDATKRPDLFPDASQTR